MSIATNDLVDVTDYLKPEPLLSDDDAAAIIETAGELAVELIERDPMKYIDPYFHEHIHSEVMREVMMQVAPIGHLCDIESEVAPLVSEGVSMCFVQVYPARSYKTTKVLHPPSVEKTRERIAYIEAVPQAEQRTPEWYEQRHNYLTASSIWKAFGTNGNRNELIYSKCQPVDVAKYSRFNLESPLHWGQKYEDVSIAWYEQQYRTKVGEFGCIPHASIPYLAASPDGINIDPTSDRYGRMVEVKNIVNREITGIPKLEYWIQMQVQLEVCGLKECDFLETRFIEYSDYDEFSADGCFTQTEDGKPKGMMMLFLDNDGQPKYEYAPWAASEEEVDAWQKKKMTDNATNAWLKNIYWRLDQVSVVLVVRNRIWLDTAKPVLDDLWATIEHERKTGSEHRAPNRRPRAASLPAQPVIRRCLIPLPTATSETQKEQPKKHAETENIVICIDTEKLQDTDQGVAT